MSTSAEKKKKSKKVRLNANIILALNVIATIVIAIFIYNQNAQIHSLSKGRMANEVLASSTQMDNLNKLGDPLNISISITSNYEGAMPITIRLIEVRLNGETITSDYKHSWLNNQEYIIEKDGKVFFNSSFEGEKVGEYGLNYLVYYDYNQEEGYQGGKTKPFTLKFVIEK